MARVTIHGGDLVVRPSWRERAVMRYGLVRAPLAAVARVEVLAEPWRCLRGSRESGLSIPDRAWLGVWRHPAGRDWIAVRPWRGPVLMVELRPPAEFARVALSVVDPQEQAARLRGAVDEALVTCEPRGADADLTAPPPV
ncbi:hypothetical protein [Streptacidiphilus neutrinimicus]|uniref:hypothetical protein n=1 Tax=Streptacidiphilus neutrinimicus TaxID=105420 RepID=UPI000695002F|nr:hypothetical protein [Streptacidiphilus neutrinimicus]